MSNDSEVRRPLRGPLSERIPKGYAAAALGALLAFNLLFWLFGVRPLAERQDAQRARIAALESHVEEKRASVERLREAEAKAAEAADSGELLIAELTFDRRTTFSQLIGKLNEAAGEAGVQMRETNYQSEEIEGSERFGMISVTANFRGRYDNLVRLLNLLDRSDAFLIIERLGAAARADTGELQITMRIDAFVRDL